MTVLQAVVLGVVQGLTEFLPVSSSGHLVLANYWFGFGGEEESLELAVDIATNTGTFLAVLIALRADVANALGGFVWGLRSAEGRRSEGWRLAMLVLLGSVPTAVIGLGLRPVFEVLNRPLWVSLALLVTGVILWTVPRRPRAKDEPARLTWTDALIGGVAQGLAVMPGISRSGATIATMMHRDATPDLAARFSFLLYLVASAGVALLGLTEVRDAGFGLAPLVGMTIGSFVVGYAALVWLFAILRRGEFRWFAPYVWAVALLTLGRIALGG